MKFSLIFLVLITLIYSARSGQYAETIPDEIMATIANQTSNKFLTLHMIAHSHDDPGFKKTFQEYYYGYNQKQAWGGVRYTLDTVIQQLIDDPELKFTQIEMIFFSKWYASLNETKREQVKQLFQEGRFQIANGGWVMNDEACAYYEDIIDQMTLGHHFLKLTLDYVPRVGWHIDPFGQSMTQAQFFDQMGFDAWFFCRLDIQDHIKRLLLKQMEFVWHSFHDTSIFTSIPFWQYGPPPGFDFDIMANNNPIVDDPESPLYNLESKARELVTFLRAVATRYRGDQFMYTFGGDFQYGDARVTYENQQTLRKYINANKDKFNINFVYSTPNDYIEALKKQNLAYPTNRNDFFPYRDFPYNWWTGFYTSRVALKSMIMDYGRYFQSIRNYLLFSTLSNSSKLTQNMIIAIEEMESTMGLCQHHDSVTGTCRQHVAFDYYRSLQRGFDILNRYLFGELQQLTGQQIGEPGVEYRTCNWNYTGAECEVLNSSLAQNKSVLLNYYNPMNKDYVRLVQIKTTLNAQNYGVIDQQNQPVPAEMICNNQTDANDCRVFFFAQLRGLSMNYYRLVPSGGIKLLQDQNMTLSFTIQMGASSLMGDSRNQNYAFVRNKRIHNFTLDWKYIPASQAKYSPSGIYVFRPDDDHMVNPLEYSKVLSKHYYIGKIISCITTWGDKIVSSLFLAKDSEILDLETFVDSINISDQQGKEIFLQVKTRIQNNKTFYTDTNGLNLIKRVVGERPTFKLKTQEILASNMYPITVGVKIMDTQEEGDQLFVLTDRAQGVTSIFDGQIDILIHRRLLKDDHKGVQEPLNETNLWNDQGLFQRLRHQILFSLDDNDFRKHQYLKDLQPIQFISQVDSSSFRANVSIQKVFDLAPQVSQNIKIYLKYWDNSSYLLRVQNLNENVTVEADISQFSILEETTMTGNQNLSSWKAAKFKWRQSVLENEDNLPEQEQLKELEDLDLVQQLHDRGSDSIQIRRKNIRAAGDLRTKVEGGFKSSSITLNPLEIRTFKIKNLST